MICRFDRTITKGFPLIVLTRLPNSESSHPPNVVTSLIWAAAIDEVMRRRQAAAKLVATPKAEESAFAAPAIAEQGPSSAAPLQRTPSGMERADEGRQKRTIRLDMEA